MSFIPKAKLYLPVRRNADVVDLTSSNGNELWETRRLLPQRIEPGDTMILWAVSSDLDYDPAGGAQWPVKNVFWDADGIMQLEMALMILDPNEAVRDAYRVRVRNGWDADFFNSTRLWDSDGDFDDNMRSGGWVK